MGVVGAAGGPGTRGPPVTVGSTREASGRGASPGGVQGVATGGASWAIVSCRAGPDRPPRKPPRKAAAGSKATAAEQILCPKAAHHRPAERRSCVLTSFTEASCVWCCVNGVPAGFRAGLRGPRRPGCSVRENIWFARPFPRSRGRKSGGSITALLHQGQQRFSGFEKLFR